MDSLTQLTFGAACAEKILGKEVGNKALVWGAILGTLPDLDVFIPFGGPVADFVFHRSFSHSIFVLALLSPLLAWIITLIHPSTKKLYLKWLLLVFVVLEGAVFLDMLTIYGTQILWPFDATPLAVPILFIIDPLFTVPILVGATVALVMKRRTSTGHRINSVGLGVSLTYIVWAFSASLYANAEVKHKLETQQVDYDQVVVSPGPFTTLLWRVVGVQGDQYFESYYSIFDTDEPLYVDFYPRNLELLDNLKTHTPVVRLEQFTKGYFALDQTKKDVVMTDLRMGSEPSYVFNFKIGEVKGSSVVPTADERVEQPRDFSQLGWVWERIWTPLPQPQQQPQSNN